MPPEIEYDIVCLSSQPPMNEWFRFQSFIPYEYETGFLFKDSIQSITVSALYLVLFLFTNTTSMQILKNKTKYT